MKYFLYIIFLCFLTANAKVNLTYQLKPSSPEEGDNKIELLLLNNNIPVENAKLELKITMPAMGSMPKMESVGKVTEKGQGKYLVEYTVSMGGSWEMSINLVTKEQTQLFLYSLTTGVPGLRSENENNELTSQTDKSKVLQIGPDRLQKIGVRFSEAKKVTLKTVLNAVGVVEEDNTNRAELNVRFSGYLEKQFIGRIGDNVKKNQKLATIYSPELIAVENEYILAHENFTNEKKIKHLTEEKLKTLGLTEDDLQEIKKQPRKTMTLRSPINGTVLAINTREGSAIKAGDVLYTIGDLSKNYIVARIFQQDLNQISKNQPVDITFNHDTTKVIKGKVDLIYPNMTEGSGTLNVRVQPSGTDEQLKPGTYVDLLFNINFGEKLCVPIESILYSGNHNYVFVDKGNGILEPREVTTGYRSEKEIEIKSGLVENERVLSSGQFLISAEAQLRSALPKWKQE